MRVFSLLLLAACTSADEPTIGDVNYYGDVQPILNDSCVECHQDGGIAPFPLTTYDEVVAVESAVVAAVENRTMPPWLATGDCNDYYGDISLTEAEIDTLASWSAEGAPEGDRALHDDFVPPGDPLPDATHTVTLPAYTPTKFPDDYRCFLVDWPDTFIVSFLTGMIVAPDQAEIVHHVIPFVTGPAGIAEYEALDEADPGPGYTCYGGPGGQMWDEDSGEGYRWLGGWAPGQQGGQYPPGTGIPVEGGSKIIVQVHYNTASFDASEVPTDASELVLQIDRGVDKWAAIMPFTDTDWVYDQQMPIPAGQDDVHHGVSMALDDEFIIHAAALHMHELGRYARFGVERANGDTECLVEIDDWDFNWQRSYGLQTPVLMNPGDGLALDCRWDNPTDSEVNWGEGTGDEMCLGTMYVTEQ